MNEIYIFNFYYHEMTEVIQQKTEIPLSRK